MNSLTFIIATLIDDMITELMANPFWFGMEPYVALLGNTFWGIYFGFLGGAVYVGGDNIYILSGYLILVIVFMAVVLPGIVFSIFGLVLGLLVGVIIFGALVRKKSE